MRICICEMQNEVVGNIINGICHLFRITNIRINFAGSANRSICFFKHGYTGTIV